MTTANKKRTLLWSGLAVLIVVILVLTTVLSVRAVFIADRVSEGTIPTTQQLQGAITYDRVVIFGVDGAGDYFAHANTPNFDRIFAGGAVTYRALSQYPTISAQNWTSMLHGVRCQKHGVNNSIAASKPYTKTEYPSIFAAYGANHPEAKFLSVCGWAPINIGSIEDMDNLTKINTEELLPEDDELDWENDLLSCSIIKEKIQNHEDYKITYIHFSHVDEVGHLVDGYGSAPYADAIYRTDRLIGELYDAYCANGMGDNTLFILVTDHGHRKSGGHGLNSKSERYVTFAVAGGLGNIVAGTPGKVVTQDLASVVLYALGEKQPDTWESKVPYHLFTTLP